MDVYNFLVTHLGVSVLDALLLILLWLVARARYQEVVREVEYQNRRLDRLERTVTQAGIRLTIMEDE